MNSWMHSWRSHYTKGSLFMPDMTNDKLNVHINVEISPSALQAIVANAKHSAPKNANGTYYIDTAQCVSTMISRFLVEKDFDSFVMNIENYNSSEI